MNPSLSPKIPKKVLLIHPFGIGDALFVTPVIRTLKTKGVDKIDLLIGSRTRSIFEANPHVGEIFEWDKTKPENFKALAERIRFLAKLFYRIWNNHYEVMIDFSPTGQYALTSLLFFWIPERVGFNFKNRGFFLTRKVDLPDGYSAKPMAEYYLDLIRLLDIEPMTASAEFFLLKNVANLMDAWAQKIKLNPRLPIISVAPGGGESWGKDARLKRWPVGNFAELLKKILEEKSIQASILILGSQNERSLGDELLHALGIPNVFNLCGELSIDLTAAFLKGSNFLIANDSGLVHLAHALSVPVVAIFGPVDPNVYGPYPPRETSVVITAQGPACRPCYQRFRYQGACSGLECLTSLSAEAVFDKIGRSRFLSAVPVAAAK